MMYQAMPARCGPLSGLRAVSKAPHSLPLANITCCIRESFESGFDMTSSCGGWAGNSNRQQPVPKIVVVVVSLMQYPCGVLVVGVIPEPGCCCFGGTPYCETDITLFVRLRAGVAEFKDDVFVKLQSNRSDEVPLPEVQTLPESHWASSVASELKKYSVPPAFVLNWFVPGDCAGQTVKPGWPLM